MREGAVLRFGGTLWVILVAGVALGMGAAAAADGAVHVTVLEPTGNGMHIVLALDPPILAPAAAKDGSIYTKVVLQGCGNDNEFGRPALPIVSYTAEIPWNAEAQVAAREEKMAEVSVKHLVYPHQPPVPKVLGPAGNPPFMIDTDYYSGAKAVGLQKAFGDGKLTATPFKKRGRQFVNILVRPFAYDPTQGLLQCPGQLDLDVTWTLNPSSGVESQGKEGGTGIIVVSNASMAAVAADYGAQKESEGFQVYDVTVSGTPSAESVRGQIRTVYDTYQPEYVVVLGDVESVPTFTSPDGDASDLLYALMDPGEGFSDYLGKDMLVGRVSVDTSGAVTNYINKLAAFVANLKHRDLTWISGGSDDGENDIAEGTHNWVMANALSEGYTNELFYRSNGAAEEFNAHVNAGTDGIVYSGHGAEYSWYRWGYGIPNMAGLTNNLDTPIVFGHCCLTGSFDLDTCFAEAWMETTTRGIVYIGGSNVTYWDEDDVLEKQEFQAMKDIPNCRVSDAVQFGLEQVHAQYPSSAEYYFTIYQCFGDPTVSLFRDECRRISCNVSGFIEVGMTVVLTAPAGTDYHWFKEGEELTGENNRTLSFDPVEEEDRGTYVCVYDDGGKAIVQTEPFELVVFLDLPAAGAACLGVTVGCILLLGVALVQRRRYRQSNSCIR